MSAYWPKSFRTTKFRTSQASIGLHDFSDAVYANAFQSIAHLNLNIASIDAMVAYLLFTQKIWSKGTKVIIFKSTFSYIETDFLEEFLKLLCFVTMGDMDRSLIIQNTDAIRVTRSLLTTKKQCLKQNKIYIRGYAVG